MLKVYCYNPKSGEFVSEIFAHEDPLDKGKYLIPKSATKTKPPTLGINEIAIYKNGSWSRVKDFRGKIFYDKITKEKIKIDFIGDIPSNVLNKLTEKEPGKEPYIIYDNNSEDWKEDAVLKEDHGIEIKLGGLFSKAFEKIIWEEVKKDSSLNAKEKKKIDNKLKWKKTLLHS